MLFYASINYRRLTHHAPPNIKRGINKAKIKPSETATGTRLPSVVQNGDLCMYSSWNDVRNQKILFKTWKYFLSNFSPIILL